ncbi:hypothetical protein QYF61_014083 [Mycteria americana]|uniref:Uncharacterized protein n=1 Tax=Mycteria americana TaxID=33587 RepID=A0AAN7RPV7_MYCAM|nr:hypothetical protein QYF61_014083 [Mycteria americana]
MDPAQHLHPMPGSPTPRPSSCDRRACSDRTRGLNEGGVRLDIGKKCLTMRVVRHWHRLPTEAVDAPSLEAFKVRLDGALSNLIQWKMSLPTAGGLDWIIFEGPFQPKPLCDSVCLPTIEHLIRPTTPPGHTTIL